MKRVITSSLAALFIIGGGAVTAANAADVTPPILVTQTTCMNCK